MAFWDEPPKKIKGMPILAIRRMIESPKTPQRLKDFWAKELHREGLCLKKVI